MFFFPALQNAKQFLQIEFMNSSVRADNVASPADLHNIFSRVRPMGFTPLASALESKVLDPYYEMLRATPAANVKPMVIYVCTDGAPTTERGLKTYQPTFTMLGKVACFLSTLLDHQLTLRQMDSMLQSLGLPRKTIGINVTQIGLDDVRVAATALTSLQRCAVTTCAGRIRIPADARRPSAVSRDAATLSLLAWLFVSHAHRTTLQFWRPNRLCQRF